MELSRKNYRSLANEAASDGAKALLNFKNDLEYDRSSNEAETNLAKAEAAIADARKFMQAAKDTK